MKSTRKTRQEAPRLQKVNSDKNLTINGQPPKSKSTVNDDVSTMTSVRADVAMMTLAMTSAGDLVARGACGSMLAETSVDA